MIGRIRFLGSAALFLAAFGSVLASPPQAVPDGAIKRAQAISSSSPWISSSLKTLKEKVRSIQDPKLRQETLSLLDQPVFHVAERRPEMETVRHRLRALELMK